VVTSGTTRFEIHTSYVLHAYSVFMYFVWISEQTAIISLYSIYWLVCITAIPLGHIPKPFMHSVIHWRPNFLSTGSLTPELIHVLGFLPLHDHSLLKDGRNSSSHTLRAGAALKEWVQTILPATACLWVAQLCAAETSKHTWIYHVNPSGYYMYSQFNIQQFSILPTQCIYVFCVDLKTKSDYFPIQH